MAYGIGCARMIMSWWGAMATSRPKRDNEDSASCDHPIHKDRRPGDVPLHFDLSALGTARV